MSFETYFQDYFNPDSKARRRSKPAPICREERQYALFLYNILMAMMYEENLMECVWKNPEDLRPIILKACGIPQEAKIVSVLYEATFMRDIFERERKINVNQEKNGNYPSAYIKERKESFNAQLYEYLCDMKGEGKIGKYLTYNGKYTVENLLDLQDKVPANHNIGGISLTNKDDPLKRCLKVMQWMMNAKPDLAVIYRKGDSQFLKFIECKYKSYEDKYESKIPQTDVQNCICSFLCQDSSVMKPDGVHLVHFQDIDIKEYKATDGKLPVSLLIPERWKESIL